MNEKDNHSDYLKLNHIYDMEEQAPKKKSVTGIVCKAVLAMMGITALTVTGMKAVDQLEQLDDTKQKD